MDTLGFGAAEPAPVGHNQPEILKTGKELELYIETTHKAILKRANDLIEAEPRLPAIIDDASDEIATEYVRKIQKCERELDRVRMLEKNPYETAAGVVHGIFRNIQDKLIRPTRNSLPGLKDRVEALQLTYKREKLRKEEEKRQAEARAAREAEEKRLKEAAEAQRIADDAAAAAARKRNPESREVAEQVAATAAETAQTAVAGLQAASAVRANAEKVLAAPAADMTRARGARGGISSLVTFWDFRSLNRERIDLEALRAFLPHDAIETAIRAYIKTNRVRVEAGHQIAGVEFFENHRVGTR